MEFVSLLDQLDRDLLREAPGLASRLRPAASIDEIKSVEAQIGQELPLLVRLAYEWHDGCESGPSRHNSIEFFGGPWRWLPLAELLAQWQYDFEGFDDSDPYFYGPENDGWADLPVRPWQTPPPQWIPIANLEGWTGNLFVDLLPGPIGTEGQIVAQNVHAMSTGVFASSFEAFLRELAAGLQERRVSAHLDVPEMRWEWRLASGMPMKIPGDRRVFG
jgi:cell wall assembly regulator SMI1